MLVKKKNHQKSFLQMINKKDFVELKKLSKNSDKPLYLYQYLIYKIHIYIYNKRNI